MGEKKLTIILTVYNRSSEYIRCAVNGILSQSYDDYSVIIVNNGSTISECDETIREFADNARVTYIKKDVNQHGGKAEAEFISWLFSLGDSEYVMWTHDDDIMTSDMIVKQMEVFEKDANVSMVAANVEYIDEYGKCLDKQAQFSSNLIYNQYEYINHRCSKNGFETIYTPTVIYKRSVINGALKYLKENNYDICDAVDLLIKMYINTKSEKIVVLGEQLYKYRIHSMQEGDVAKLGVITYISQQIIPFLEKLDGTGVLKDFSRYKDDVLLHYKRTSYGINLDNKILSLLKDKDINIIKDDSFRKLSNVVHEDSIKRSILRAMYIKQCKNDICEYVIWGCGKAGDLIRTIMEYMVPQMKCIGYIDSFQSGEKHGLPIWQCDEFKFNKDVYVIVGATLFENEIGEILKDKGLEYLEDFMPQFI